MKYANVSEHISSLLHTENSAECCTVHTTCPVAAR